MGQVTLPFQVRGIGQQGQFGERVFRREDPWLAREADAHQNSRLLRPVGQVSRKTAPRPPSPAQVKS